MMPVAGHVMLMNKLKQQIRSNIRPAGNCGVFYFK